LFNQHLNRTIIIKSATYEASDDNEQTAARGKITLTCLLYDFIEINLLEV
jgi:hypothetical protein